MHRNDIRENLEAHKVSTELRHHDFTDARKELANEAHHPLEFKKLVDKLKHELKTEHQHPLTLGHDRHGNITHLNFDGHDIFDRAHQPGHGKQKGHISNSERLAEKKRHLEEEERKNRQHKAKDVPLPPTRPVDAPAATQPGDPPAAAKPGDPLAAAKPGDRPAAAKPGDPPAAPKPGDPPAAPKLGDPPAAPKPGDPPAAAKPGDPPATTKAGGDAPTTATPPKPDEPESIVDGAKKNDELVKKLDERLQEPARELLALYLKANRPSKEMELLRANLEKLSKSSVTKIEDKVHLLEQMIYEMTQSMPAD